MRIGRGRIKGLYRATREAWLWQGRTLDVAASAAGSYLQGVGADVAVDHSQQWFQVIMAHIQTGRSWFNLPDAAREEIIDAVRGGI